MNPQLTKLLRPNEQEAIATFLSRLWRQQPGRICQAVLFGSKARGDSQADSDIDILLIVDNNDWRFSHAISDLAADVSLEYGLLIGPRVIGRDRWQRMQRERFSLYENVVREGIPLTPESA
jgi:predicted nucleotidyltransferase